MTSGPGCGERAPHGPLQELEPTHPRARELAELGLLKAESGTALWVEQLLFGGADTLLRRRRVESYLDGFTVVGDLRSGLFETRLAFSQVATGATSDHGLTL